MSLVRHIRQQNWSALEESWTEHILDSGEIAPALDALRAAAQRKAIPRCLPMVREHAEILVESERAAGAAELLGTALLLGGSPGELAKLLFLSAEAAWGKDDTWEVFCELADFRENVPDMRKAWTSFRRLCSLEPGRAVYHGKGWGLGEIQAIDLPQREAKIRFASGRRDRFPFSTAIEIFEILEKEDLRVLVVLDPDELKRRLRSEPLDILRWILQRNNGKVAHAGIKLAMGMLGVEGGGFTTWWRRARKAAETSEWFELSGPANRLTVRILDQAEDPAEGIRRQLNRSANLGEALTRVKVLLHGSNPPEDVRTAALETLRELARDEKAVLSQRLAAWLFMREETGETPPMFTELMHAAAEQPAPDDPSKPPALWQLFAKVPTIREQERCIVLLHELYGKEEWLDASAPHLHHAAPGMARGIIEAMENAGRQEELIAHYTNLLVRSGHNPTVLIALGERVETGEWEEQLPPPLRRAQCLLQLAVYLVRNSVANTILTRARGRLSNLLTTGDPPLLRRVLRTANIDDLRGLAILLDSGIDSSVDRLFTKIAVEVSPNVFCGEEKPFWQTGGIWTTRPGLTAQQEELRILRDVKIPENAEAIGKAASYGDLSENSEWEAAIEEQRNLTARAMQLETDLRDTQLIEDAAIPDGVVAPGTRVRYREVLADRVRTVRILGPWDGDGEDVISYRSPLAAAMLGKKSGASLSVDLPSGKIDIEIQEITPLDI
jgi:transcription elongation GreA/GreB family factor